MIIPTKLKAALGMDGRHKCVPLMADCPQFENDELQPYHPRIGAIQHGHGHADHKTAETIAQKIAVAYNCHDELLSALENLILNWQGNKSWEGVAEARRIAAKARGAKP